MQLRTITLYCMARCCVISFQNFQRKYVSLIVPQALTKEPYVFVEGRGGLHAATLDGPIQRKIFWVPTCTLSLHFARSHASGMGRGPP